MKEIDFKSTIFFVGQNCSENDDLFKKMSGNCTWFHLDQTSSSHVYCTKTDKLTREEIKKGAQLVKEYSKKSGKVIYIKKNKLKKIGPGIVELLGEPKYI